MSDNLDTLRTIAEAATPGPWEVRNVTEMDADGVTDLAHVLASELETEDAVQAVATGVTREDAHHIATFDPPAVLALLSRLEQAEQAVARVRVLHSMTFYDKWGRSSLEPVGHGGWCSICGRFDGASCDTIRALDGEQE